MKSDKILSLSTPRNAIARLSFAALVCINVVACNSVATKPVAVEQADAEPTLLSTAEYIPTIPTDKKTGAELAYLALPNPYTLQKGRIEKESVIAFIDAKRAYNNKHYAKAKQSLNKLTNADKSLSGPWVLLGDIATRDNNLTLAAEHYTKAISINKANSNAYLKLALTQRKLGQFLPAQNTYAAALAQWRDFPEAHLNLGILYDIYLNHPIRAQRHLEAYQFLTQGESTQVASWLEDIKARTGLKIVLAVQDDALVQSGVQN